MPRRSILFALAAAVAVLGLWAAAPVLPRAAEAWAWLEAQDDPVALSGLALSAPDVPARWREAMGRALDEDDVELAASLLVLADAQGLPRDPALVARYAQATTAVASARRGAAQFLAGAGSGEAQSPAGLAGVLAADLSGIGDLRDLAREGGKLARGEEADDLVLGLAAVGLVVTGATVASLGMGAPARGGITTLKAAVRAGRVSQPLRGHLVRLSRTLVDGEQVRLAVRSASSLDPVATRAALATTLRPAVLRQVGDMAGDLAVISGKGGARAAQEALALAREPAELRRVARLAEARGAATPAVLRLLGRGAVVLTAGAATLAGWVMAGLVWAASAFLFAAILARRFGALLGRTVRFA